MLVSVTKSHFNFTSTENISSSISSSEDCDMKLIFFACFHSNFAQCLIADVHTQIHTALPSLSLSAYSHSPTLLPCVAQDEKGFRKMQGTFTSQSSFHFQSRWTHKHLESRLVSMWGEFLQREFPIPRTGRSRKLQ